MFTRRRADARRVWRRDERRGGHRTGRRRARDRCRHRRAHPRARAPHCATPTRGGTWHRAGRRSRGRVIPRRCAAVRRVAIRLLLPQHRSRAPRSLALAMRQITPRREAAFLGAPKPTWLRSMCSRRHSSKFWGPLARSISRKQGASGSRLRRRAGGGGALGARVFGGIARTCDRSAPSSVLVGTMVHRRLLGPWRGAPLAPSARRIAPESTSRARTSRAHSAGHRQRSVPGALVSRSSYAKFERPSRGLRHARHDALRRGGGAVGPRTRASV